jgi:hypothetical protein
VGESGASGPPPLEPDPYPIRQRVVDFLRRIAEDKDLANAHEKDSTFVRAVGRVLIVGAISLLVLGELNALLQGMHLPGRPSAGIQDIAGPLTQWRDTAVVEHTSRIVDLWRDHSNAVELVDRGYTTGLGLGTWYLIIDSFVFVPSYIALLALVGFRAIWRTEKRRDELSEASAAVFDPTRIRITLITVLFFLAISDLAENLLQWLAVSQAWEGDPATFVVQALKVSGLVKTALILVALLFVVGGLVFASGRGRQVGRRGRALVNVRLQAVVLALFALVLLLPEQAWDVPRSWSLLNATAAVGLTALLGAVSWVTAMWLQDAADRPHDRRSIRNRNLLGVAAVLILAGLVFRFLIGTLEVLPWGVLIPGLLLLAVVLLSMALESGTAPRPASTSTGPNRQASTEERKEAERERRATGEFARFLAAAPLVIVGLAMVRASAGHLFYAPHIEGLHMALLLVGGAAALPVMAGRLHKRLDPKKRGGRRGPAIAAVAALIAVAMLTVWISPNGWLTGSLGVVGLLCVFLIVVILLGAGLVRMAERFEPPTVFKLFSVTRIPVLTLLVLWLALATVMEPPGYHDARVMGSPTAGQSESGMTLRDAFDRWLEKNGLEALAPAGTGPAPPEGRPATPLVLVAGSGGGIRAAFWTAAVLDCLTEVQPNSSDPTLGPCDPQLPRATDFTASNRVFAMSGISGGSLGLAAYAAHLTRKAEGRAETGNWVADRLSADFLSPDLGWFLLVETFRAFLLFRPQADRAEVMEEAWERTWGGVEGEGLSAGLLATQREVPEVPLLLLNGATVNEGCRFNASILNVGPDSALRNCLSTRPFEGAPTAQGGRQSLVATQDLVDYLCPGQGIRLSTAAGLSARFPFVSPAGRIKAQCTPEGTVPPVTYVVDGGYFDVSAASPLVELAGSLAPRIDEYNRRTANSCVVPFMVQVDNGYDIPDPPPRDRKPAELLAPKQAKDVSTQGWIANAKQSVAAVFTRPFAAGPSLAMVGGWPLSDRYVHIYPRAHPGVQAPLGWLLSNAARQDLRGQLGSRENAEAIAEVRAWSSGEILCAGQESSSDHAGGSFGLPFALDLSEGWWVTEAPDRLSLFREGPGLRASITAIRSGDAQTTIGEAQQSLMDAGAMVGSPTATTLGGLSGYRLELSSLTEGRGYEFAGLRFEQDAGQTAELLTLDVPSATVIVVVVRDPGTPSDLEAAGVARVLSAAASA